MTNSQRGKKVRTKREGNFIYTSQSEYYIKFFSLSHILFSRCKVVSNFMVINVLISGLKQCLPIGYGIPRSKLLTGENFFHEKVVNMKDGSVFQIHGSLSIELNIGR